MRTITSTTSKRLRSTTLGTPGSAPIVGCTTCKNRPPPSPCRRPDSIRRGPPFPGRRSIPSVHPVIPPAFPRTQCRWRSDRRTPTGGLARTLPGSIPTGPIFFLMIRRPPRSTPGRSRWIRPSARR